MVKSITYVILILLVTMSNLTIISNTQHRNEVVSSLRHGMYVAMDATYQSMSKYLYKPTNDWNEANTNQKLASEFNRALLAQIESDCELEIKIIKIDAKNGLIDVEATAYFPYSNGKTGHTTYRCSMVSDESEPTPNPVLKD